MADISKEARAQAAAPPPRFNPEIARKIKAVLDATEGQTDIEILLALGESAAGVNRLDWLAEIEHQKPGLLGKRE